MIFKEEYEVTDDLRELLKHLSCMYKRVFNQPFDFYCHVQDKFKTVEKARCLVMYDNNIPVGFAFFEKISAFYGAITLHVKAKKYCKALSKAAFKQNYFHNHLLELIVYEHQDVYRKSFKQYGMVENYRQRMSLSLYPDEFFSEIETPYYFQALDKDRLKISSQLSYLAHEISQDYFMYPGMNNVDNRHHLEQIAYNGLYGELNQDASFFMCHGQDIIGYCMVVNVECWGKAGVPWIFDISVRPEWQGKGIGRNIMHHMINVCVRQSFEYIGLAVTMTNTNAISLYESLGFQALNTFYEFIYEAAPTK